MPWRVIAAILLVGMLLGAASSIAWRASQTETAPTITSPKQKVTPPPSPSIAVVPPQDPSLDSHAPAPPQSLPPLSADFPPATPPAGGLPPLPLPGGGSMPLLAPMDQAPPAQPLADGAMPVSERAPAPPVQRLTPPKGHTRIEKAIRQIDGVSSLAWGENKTLHILVRNASPAAVARTACSRANAVASGIRVHAQSVSSPAQRSVQRNC